MDGLKESIGGLKGAKVRFFFQDSQFVDGILLAVKQDYLVVKIDDNIFYFSLKKIAGITKNVKDTQVLNQIPPYVDKNYLTDVLNSLKYNYITINGLSKEIFDGVLMSIHEDCIVIVNNTKLHFINSSNIFNVIKGEYKHPVKQGVGTTALNTQSNVENPLEKKEANLSDGREVLIRSEEIKPTSSLVEKMTESDDLNNKGKKSTVTGSKKINQKLLVSDRLVNEIMDLMKSNSNSLQGIIENKDDSSVKSDDEEVVLHDEKPIIKNVSYHPINLSVSNSENLLQEDQIIQSKQKNRIKEKSLNLLTLDGEEKFDTNQGHISSTDNSTSIAIPSIIPRQLEMSETQLESDKTTKEIYELTKEEKMLFEVQCLALIKHSEKMLNNLDFSHDCIKNMTSEGIQIYKKQYSSLLNSAKKMYNQMKNERLN